MHSQVGHTFVQVGHTYVQPEYIGWTYVCPTPLVYSQLGHTYVQPPNLAWTYVCPTPQLRVGHTYVQAHNIGWTYVCPSSIHRLDIRMSKLTIDLQGWTYVCPTYIFSLDIRMSNLDKRMSNLIMPFCVTSSNFSTIRYIKNLKKHSECY